MFDPLGLASVRTSYRMLAAGGTLVAYGTAASQHGEGSVSLEFLRMFARILAWKVLPDGHRATFYDFWGASRTRPTAFFARRRKIWPPCLTSCPAGASHHRSPHASNWTTSPRP